jgi:hypothetical protein
MNTVATEPRASWLNALCWGDAIDGFLPCKRVHCEYVDVCRRDPLTRKYGFPPYGSDCRLEQADHEEFVTSAKDTFAFTKGDMSETEFEATLARLSMLNIRMRRILARLTAEGLLKEIPLPNGKVLLREPIASKRYWPTVAREIEAIYEKLLPEPEPDPTDQPLALPFTLPASSETPVQPNTTLGPSFDNPRRTISHCLEHGGTSPESPTSSQSRVACHRCPGAPCTEHTIAVLPEY